MKRHVRTLCGGLLLAAAFSILPARSLRAAETPSAIEIAARVNEHYNRLRTLRTHFTQSYEGMGQRRVESGLLLLQKPGQMRWQYEQPAGKLFVLDGKYAWFYTRGATQAQRAPARQLDDLRSPLRFLLGRTRLEKELTGLSLAPAPGGKFLLSGLPRGEEKRIARLTLTVAPDGAIAAIQIEEADGAQTRFTFANEVPNPPLAQELFRFSPPEGVSVVDAGPTL